MPVIVTYIHINQHTYSIELFSTDGRVLVSTDERVTSKNVSKDLFFSNFKAGNPATGTLIEHERVVLPGLAVSAYIRSSSTGKPIAILTQFVLLTELNDILKNTFYSKTLGAGLSDIDTMEAYLVNRDGFMITGSRFLNGAVLKKKVETEPVKACQKSAEDFAGFYSDYRGVKVAGSTRYIETLNWALLVKIDQDEALAAVVDMRNDALRAAAVVAGLVVVLFAVFYKKVILQIQRLSAAVVARGLRIKSVAEFVETNESLELLRSFGVDYAQGYLIGKPGPALATKLKHDLK